MYSLRWRLINQQILHSLIFVLEHTPEKKNIYMKETIKVISRKFFHFVLLFLVFVLFFFPFLLLSFSCVYFFFLSPLSLSMLDWIFWYHLIEFLHGAITFVRSLTIYIYITLYVYNKGMKVKRSDEVYLSYKVQFSATWSPSQTSE